MGRNFRILFLIEFRLSQVFRHAAKPRRSDGLDARLGIEISGVNVLEEKWGRQMTRVFWLVAVLACFPAVLSAEALVRWKAVTIYPQGKGVLVSAD